MARASKLDLSAKAAENKSKTSEADWLVFADESGIDNKITARLAKQNKNCVIVKKGSGFKKVSDNLFEIDTLEQSGPDKLVDTLAGNGKF